MLGALGHRKNILLNLNIPEMVLRKDGREIDTS